MRGMTRMNEYKCIHEELIQNHSLEIKGLEARADYKDARLDEVDKRLERMEDKIDNLAEAVNQLHLESLQDDKDIDKRLTAVETTVRVLKWIVSLLFGTGIIWVIFSIMK